MKQNNREIVLNLNQKYFINLTMKPLHIYNGTLKLDLRQ